MRSLILLFILTSTVGVANAADLPSYYEPIITYEVEGPASPQASRTWDGYFFGASAIANADPLSLGGEAFVGVTTTADRFLYGGVLAAGLLSMDDGEGYIEMTSRFGLVVAENVAAFAVVGAGYETAYNGTYGVIGSGLSVAISDGMTFDSTVRARYLSGAPGGDEWQLVGGVGLAFHF